MYNVFLTTTYKGNSDFGGQWGRMLLPGIAKVKQQPPRAPRGMTVGGQETQVPVTYSIGLPKTLTLSDGTLVSVSTTYLQSTHLDLMSEPATCIYLPSNLP